MATRNLTAVEGLRFLLFLGIFVFHCVNNWLPIGWGGVEAFLVIGAFFLTRKQLKVERTSIRIADSFFGRIKRLYPIYLTLLILATLGYVYATHQITAEPLWYLFSLQNFRCLFESASYSLDSFLGHFWYISLDVWLFLVWVVILRIVPRKHIKAAFVISLLIGILWRTLFVLLVPENISIAYMIPIGMLDCWAIGGLVALNLKDKGENKIAMRTELVLGLIGIVLITLYNAKLNNIDLGEAYLLYRRPSGYMLNPITGNIHLFIALLFAGILRYCVDTSQKHPILSTLPLVVLGGMTYELYCFHFPIISAARHFIHNDILLIIVALLATYIVAFLWNKLAIPVVHRIVK